MAIPEFSEFFAVLRSRDAAAIEKMLNELEPFLRRVIHLRLMSGRPLPIVDTTDVLQSLLKDFLQKTAEGTGPAERSGQLAAYLKAAVHRKVSGKARKESRNVGGLPDGWDVPGPDADVARRIENDDLFEALRARLGDSERQVLELRARGLTWDEIGVRLGAKPDTLRIGLQRSVAGALAAMGLGEANDGP
jgi:DNA-directed RNA polymerase specialized sigma24 family protein